MRWSLGIADLLNRLRDLPPLFFRLILAWGFHSPFKMKLGNMAAFTEFLASMHYPFPVLSGYIAMITEGVGIAFLILGLCTRLITLPLMFMMVIAIATVHWKHGFAASHDGFEIPLYYLLMLFSLLATGPGRISLDALIARRFRKKAPEQIQ